MTSYMYMVLVIAALVYGTTSQLSDAQIDKRNATESRESVCNWSTLSAWLVWNTCIDDVTIWNSFRQWLQVSPVGGDTVLDYISSWSDFYATVDESSLGTHVLPGQNPVVCEDNHAMHSIWGNQWTRYLPQYNLSVVANLTDAVYTCMDRLQAAQSCSGIVSYLDDNCTDEVTTLIADCGASLLAGNDCTSMLGRDTHSGWGTAEYCNEPCQYSWWEDHQWSDEHVEYAGTDQPVIGCTRANRNHPRAVIDSLGVSFNYTNIYARVYTEGREMRVYEERGTRCATSAPREYELVDLEELRTRDRRVCSRTSPGNSCDSVKHWYDFMNDDMNKTIHPMVRDYYPCSDVMSTIITYSYDLVENSPSAVFTFRVYMFEQSGTITTHNNTYTVQRGDVKVEASVADWHFCDGDRTTCNGHVGTHLRLVFDIRSSFDQDTLDDIAGGNTPLGYGNIVAVGDQATVDGAVSAAPDGFPTEEQLGNGNSLRTRYTLAIPAFTQHGFL